MTGETPTHCEQCGEPLEHLDPLTVKQLGRTLHMAHCINEECPMFYRTYTYRVDRDDDNAAAMVAA